MPPPVVSVLVPSTLLRSLRPGRRTAVASAALLLSVSLAACGSDDGAEGGTGLDAVDVSGEVGSAPEVAFGDRMDVEGQETETLAEGDGAELAAGDSVIVNYWIGNGFTGEPVTDSYEPRTPGALVTLGTEPQQPQTVDQVAAVAASRLVESGMTVGSRIATVGTPPEVLSLPGVPELGIGNLDPIVMVVDLVEQPLEGPEGTDVEDVPAWVPELERDGAPVRLDFQGIPEPTDELRSFAVIEGDGPAVERGDLLVADYLGQVYGGDRPFDESYSADPVGFGIGLGQVIEGWDEALVGQRVGSRVVLAVPPAQGYGQEGNPQAGIEGDDTLYFVVDVLGAA